MTLFCNSSRGAAGWSGNDQRGGLKPAPNRLAQDVYFFLPVFLAFLGGAFAAAFLAGAFFTAFFGAAFLAAALAGAFFAAVF